MNPIRQIPSPSKDRLFVVFLTDENQERSISYLDKNLNFRESTDTNLGASSGREVWRSGDLFLLCLGLGEHQSLNNELLRKKTWEAISFARDYAVKDITFIYLSGKEKTEEEFSAIAEAGEMSNYSFLHYKSEKPEKKPPVLSVYVQNDSEADAVERGNTYADANAIARDLVNEPLITLTAEEMARRAEDFGRQYGFSVEVFNKSKIESLKMGGLLAVNYGSQDPPTFTIMEWKPEQAKNSKPVVLVGKGVVFDTGGLSLKPTANSMDFMKSDMAGAAAVIGAMAGIAALKLPVHVVGLVPATDNRPGEKAYVPGDVITMFDGTTVEVLNTDAEGRMLLADALSYAKKYDPELVIDLATLTGAAVVAVGIQGLAMMSTAEEPVKDRLKQAGQAVYERLVEFPLWDEYKDQLKSDIADLKNVGGRAAGSITAAKFLEHFTDYPWVHLDIAGSAFVQAPDSYRGKNGTGVGVRLLLDFLRNY